MTTWIAVILLGGLIGLDATSFPQAMISRPIVAAALTGALFGRPVEGIVIGFVIEAFALSTLPIGAARYPESGTAAVAATSAGLAAAPAGLTPAHLALALAIALVLERLAAVTVMALRRINGRLLITAGGVAPAQLERRHLAAMSLDFARGALVSGAGGLVGLGVIAALAPLWALPAPFTVGLLAVVSAVAVGSAIPLFGGARARPIALAGGMLLGLLAALVVP